MKSQLEKYALSPQEQLAVAHYLKSMNKTQAARDAGYQSPTVFQKPSIQAAVADLMRQRAERLLVGSDWVLVELMRLYERCMKAEKMIDANGNVIGEKWDSKGALRALDLIGKHCDVRAFAPPVEEVRDDDEIVNKIRAGRRRAHERNRMNAERQTLSFI